ncbi:MAG TPA: hypothetical protein VLX68_11980 [Chitinivibrionales bacterium]|nr:hypothetical protein [Chitinivibrionales bacterium]
MKLRSKMTINGKTYPAGSTIPWYMLYPFFMVHMLIFGLSGFFMAYGSKNTPVLFLYAHGGLAITVYVVFYLVMFGLDEVKWMFINAGLGILGIYSQIGWVLSLFGKKVGNYPFYVHVIPFLYFVLYTFLIRHAFLDIFQAREDGAKKKIVEYAYIILSLGLYVGSYFLQRR